MTFSQYCNKIRQVSCMCNFLTCKSMLIAYFWKIKWSDKYEKYFVKQKGDLKLVGYTFNNYENVCWHMKLMLYILWFLDNVMAT